MWNGMLMIQLKSLPTHMRRIIIKDIIKKTEWKRELTPDETYEYVRMIHDYEEKEERIASAFRGVLA